MRSLPISLILALLCSAPRSGRGDAPPPIPIPPIAVNTVLAPPPLTPTAQAAVNALPVATSAPVCIPAPSPSWATWAKVLTGIGIAIGGSLTVYQQLQTSQLLP